MIPIADLSSSKQTQPNRPLELHFYALSMSFISSTNLIFSLVARKLPDSCLVPGSKSNEVVRF